MRYQGLPDEDVLALVGAGREDALEVLYTRYSRQVYSLALYMLKDPEAAEEVTQEVFLSVWRRSRTFDPARGKASTWIMSIAHHRAVDLLRQRRRRPSLPVQSDPPAEPPGEGADSEIPAVLEMARLRVRQAVEQLPPEQRQPLLLAYFEGYTQAEIARMLGQPLGTVKTRIRLGLQRLRQMLSPGPGEGVEE